VAALKLSRITTRTLLLPVCRLADHWPLKNFGAASRRLSGQRLGESVFSGAVTGFSMGDERHSRKPT
jgi:hypothetical protein